MPKKSFKCSRPTCGHVSKSQGDAVRHGWEHRRADAKKAAKKAGAVAPKPDAPAVAVPQPRKPRVAVGPARITYTPSVEELGVLLDHYRQQGEKVDLAMATIRRQLGGKGAPSRPVASTSTPATHRISAEGRARIAAAQRRRWAAAKTQPVAAPAAI